MPVTRYSCCVTWFKCQPRHIRVTMVFADGLVPMAPGHLQPPWWRGPVGFAMPPGDNLLIKSFPITSDSAACYQVTVVLYNSVEYTTAWSVDTSRPKQNGRHVADDISKYTYILPERTRCRPWGRLRVRIRSIEKTWIWKIYPAAQNFTNRMLFWNTHIFETINLLWKRYHLIHRSSIFSTIQRNNQHSTRNTCYILQLCCALVRDLT